MYEYNQCSYILFFESLRKPYVHVTYRMYEYNQCSYILFFECLRKPYFECFDFGISWKVEAKFFSLNIRRDQKFQTCVFLMNMRESILCNKLDAKASWKCLLPSWIVFQTSLAAQEPELLWLLVAKTIKNLDVNVMVFCSCSSCGSKCDFSPVCQVTNTPLSLYTSMTSQILDSSMHLKVGFQLSMPLVPVSKPVSSNKSQFSTSTEQEADSHTSRWSRMPIHGGFLCKDIIKDAFVLPRQEVVKRPCVQCEPIHIGSNIQNGAKTLLIHRPFFAFVLKLPCLTKRRLLRVSKGDSVLLTS